MLSDIPTVFKMFTETTKWMWIVAEEWWNSDGSYMSQLDVKEIMSIWLAEIWKCDGKSLSVGLVWTFNWYQE